MAKVGPKVRPPIDLFMAKVVQTPDCWEWTAFISPFGYAYFGKHRAARWYWEYLNGPLSKDLVIDHLCRNRACVNPAHLEPVTWRENVLRGEGHAAKNAKKTHCKHGHEFTERNIYRSRKGARVCKICKSRAEVKRQRIRRFERKVGMRVIRRLRSRAWAQTLGAFTHTIKTDESPQDVFLRLQPFQRKVFEDVCQSFAYDDSELPF